MFAIVLLAVFAVGTVENVAGATKMSLKMSAIEMGDMDMGDCQGCPSDDDVTPVCTQACMVPLNAIMSTDLAELPPVRSVFVVSIVSESDGHIRPPQPFPPRVILLT